MTKKERAIIDRLLANVLTRRNSILDGIRSSPIDWHDQKWWEAGLEYGLCTGYKAALRDLLDAIEPKRKTPVATWPESGEK